MLSSQYKLILIHGIIWNMSQAGVYPLCELHAVQNLSVHTGSCEQQTNYDPPAQ